MSEKPLGHAAAEGRIGEELAKLPKAKGKPGPGRPAFLDGAVTITLAELGLPGPNRPARPRSGRR